MEPRYLLYLLGPASKHVLYKQCAISSTLAGFFLPPHLMELQFAFPSHVTWKPGAPSTHMVNKSHWWIQSPSKSIVPFFFPLISLIKCVLRQGNSPSSEFCSDGYLNPFCVCFVSKHQIISKFICFLLMLRGHLALDVP